MTNTLAACSLVALAAATPALADADATAPGHEATLFEARAVLGGTSSWSAAPYTLEALVPAAPDVAGSPGPLGRAGGPVVWSRNLTDAIFTSCGASIPTASLFAGTYLNPPMQAERHELDGDGTPTWTFAGPSFEAAAARHADVLAATDANAAAQTITAYGWRAASETPEWAVEIAQATAATRRTVAVSDDGSTVAVLVNDQGGESARAALRLFDGASGALLAMVTAADGHFARNLSVTPDGAFVAFMGGATVYVVDRDANAIRQSFSAGATNDPIAISRDGGLVAYGWTTLFVREWNGTSYVSLWARAGGGQTLRACRFSADGSTFAVAWSAASLLRNRIELYETPSSMPLWTYDYALGSGGFQDIVSELGVTADGSYVAASSWGDQGNTNPEVHLLAREQPGPGPNPVLTVDTPGSMFDVRVARGPNGVIRVAACGKHIHANQSGRGGDLYSIRYATACTADVDGDGAVTFADLLAVLAAWGDCPDCAEDIDGDGAAGFSDLLEILAQWGAC